MRLDVNTDAAIQLTAKLEKLHKSAFPSAVRNTLNDAAFESKKLIPKEASKNFTIRQRNLFTRFSVVERASGFDVNKMSSKIGIDAGERPKLADGLSKQETGGTLKGRKLTPHDQARVSGSYGKKLKAKNQFKNIGEIGTPRNRIKGAKYFRIKKGSKETVFENNKGRLTPIYNYRRNAVNKIKAQPFIKPSVESAAKRMESFYFKNAQFQFKKYLK